MPKVNHVKRAQQRYATKPVIDPETGVQKVVPMISSRTGEQKKKTKHGRPVFLRITERDLDRPLPMPQCDYPGCKHESREIAVGTPYKWIEPSGSYIRNRHADCPTWNVWEYSSSLSARIAQITDEQPEDFASAEDATTWLEGKAQEIRDLAEEKRESSENIVEGFGHETTQSEDLAQIADDLESWADEVEGTDLPEFPENEEIECDDCEGTGHHEDQPDDPECETCEGKGTTEGEDPTEEAVSEWNDEVRSLIEDALSNCPV